jgi:hypothetical protein
MRKLAPLNKFAVPVKNFPVLRNIFPVNLRREFHEKTLQRSHFLLGDLGLGVPKSRNSLLNSLIAGNLTGDRCDQHSVASQAVPRSDKSPRELAESPANGGLLQFGIRSPGSQTREMRGQFVESLRPLPRIFPFSGDWRWRQGSMATARRGRSPNDRAPMLRLQSVCGETKRSQFKPLKMGETLVLSPLPGADSIVHTKPLLRARVLHEVCS